MPIREGEGSTVTLFLALLQQKKKKKKGPKSFQFWPGKTSGRKGQVGMKKVTGISKMKKCIIILKASQR